MELTSLVATYLVGQLMRSNFQIAQLLESPGVVSDELVEGLVDRAAMVLHERADEHTATDRVDDYKVDFKRESALRSLGSRARVMGFDGSP